ncbi:MAG TPA: SDR family NAD(P)-dependent oxidoreductase [Steroidobacteraceae bacterium]|nr:SDR family NAD(P)-dependent oxidoreductase [Steroidobacteraceae bacterium]
MTRALDSTIVLSFDRTGFARHAAGFDPADLDVDLTGRTCLVTGANSGIGLETSRALARMGATVWMLCRDRERGSAAVKDVRGDSGSRHVHLRILDVADLDSIRRFVAEFPGSQVDVLVHNAGVLPDERIATADGIELTFATHVRGPFVLTSMLLPKLRAAGQARVIFVSSGGMYTRRLSLDDWQWHERPYDGVIAYAQTKRMQVVMAEMMAERLQQDGIVVHSMHPGWADTQAVRTSLPRFWSTMRPLLRSADQAADTVVWLAASAAAVESTGRFWFDREPRSTHLLPWTNERAEDRAALWELCEQWATPPSRRSSTAGRRTSGREKGDAR